MSTSHSASSSLLSTVPSPTQIYTLSLHDALPISTSARRRRAYSPWLALENRGGNANAFASETFARHVPGTPRRQDARSEEHTSELQSHSDLVCRLLLEKKK